MHKKLFLGLLAIILTLHTTTYADCCDDLCDENNCALGGLYFTGSFIYWRPAFLEYAAAAKFAQIGSSPEGNREFLDVQNLGFPFAPGFKFGVGYRFTSCDLDLFVNWTHLRSHPHKSISSSPNYLIINLDQNAPQILASSANTKGHIGLDVCDVELAKSYCLNDWGVIRPFAGLKSVWLRYSFKTNFFDPFEDNSNIIANVQNIVDDHIFGIGPRIGLNTRWCLGSPAFALLINAAGSFLWENFKPTLSGLYTSSGRPQGGEVTGHIRGFNPVGELFVGLSYARCIYGVHANATIGYEVQYWPDQAQGFMVNTSESFSVQGLTASLEVAF